MEHLLWRPLYRPGRRVLVSRRERLRRHGRAYHQDPEVRAIPQGVQGRLAAEEVFLATSSCDPNNLSGEMDGLRQRRVNPSGAGIEVCVPCAEDHAACGAGRHCEGCGNACDCGSVRLGRRRARTPARPRLDPRPARSSSATVTTSWPSCRSPSTVGLGKFSSAKRRANG